LEPPIAPQRLAAAKLTERPTTHAHLRLPPSAIMAAGVTFAKTRARQAAVEGQIFLIAYRSNPALILAIVQ
jgi:hypothetical protein